MEPEVLRSFTFSTSPFSWKRAIASSVGTVKRRIGILESMISCMRRRRMFTSSSTTGRPRRIST